MPEEREHYAVEEKLRTVLAVWTERKTGTQVCRELKLSTGLFWQWQDRALSGMLEALEPRRGRENSEGPALPEQIRRLLERKVRSRELSAVGRRPLARARPPQPRAAPAVPAPAPTAT